MRLNGRSESPSSHAERLTASKKYKFSEQENISCEFYEVKLGKQGFALRRKTLEQARKYLLRVFAVFGSEADENASGASKQKLVSKPQGLRHKVPSEASDGLPAIDKLLSETSDGLPATDKMPSETSDGLPATDKVLSEASDGFTASDRTLSEASDGFTATDKALSEGSDAFIRSLRSLTSFCLLAPLAFLSALRTKNTKTRGYLVRKVNLVNNRRAGGGGKKYKGVYP